MDAKTKRQQTLRELLASEEVRSQAQAVRLMKGRGYAVTQSSVSRDFRELGVVRAGNIYALPELVAERAAPPARKLRAGDRLVHSVESVGPFMVVVKTSEGAASVVAARLDHLEVNGVVGTVAGDDTIFVATKKKSAQKRLTELLLGWADLVK